VLKGARDLISTPDTRSGTLARRHFYYVVTVEQYSARVRTHVARDHGEQRGLSRTVRTDHPYCVTLVQLEGDLVSDYYLTESSRDTFQLEQRHEERI
jgi:hypothetical protein